MKTGVARLYRFKATHSLPDAGEPWCFPHEHTYTIEVEKSGPIAGDMVIDTDLIDRRWHELRPRFEGQDLNAMLGITTTVEQIAAWLLEVFGPDLADRVTVWEDQDRWGRAVR